ncbi:MAG: hypothetical protein AUG06_11280 [Actinobacteria bacterium 13_1_20CM_2_65_11]|nr:MAG: hypothetical protein AUH40_10055 [Chloroflexi bacterium 13_1_40CM_65_17]OLC64799.1 MAG: hypothetical protein AUH69_11280 [Actinobacteria bacterium 13_1_40CM_4_65_12]OLD26058.1 MAG: hypothetical protein AUJ02_03325 [Chloroflexi bacterium 13_1_40CM_3_65_12]OLD49234.1 MAG: hypothetical protein AUI42_08870 [Actinobacteria bacterium 13_1_40CM_2_65_8]OLE78252.1 MAG: hypothetical protein AUG06_11280 [Actinobacteria bacterium 13_1_20CM_2_65_11]
MTSEAGFHRLTELVADAMHGGRPMTEHQIVKAIYRRSKVTTDARSVRLVLASDRQRFGRLRPRFRFFQRSTKWQLVVVGPADNPGPQGAPVPARPYPPTRSGAAAADLTFREDEPPTNAIGRTA